MFKKILFVKNISLYLQGAKQKPPEGHTLPLGHTLDIPVIGMSKPISDTDLTYERTKKEAIVEEKL